VCAGCNPVVSITSSASPPYGPGDTLTCVADLYDYKEPHFPTYQWVGTNGGSPFFSSSPTVTLLGSEFCLYCIARWDAETSKPEQADYCSGSAYICDIITNGEYRKHYIACEPDQTLLRCYLVDGSWAIMS